MTARDILQDKLTGPTERMGSGFIPHHLIIAMTSTPRSQITHTASAREATLYARVSSREQEKEGFSIPSQLKLLRNYAEQQRLTIV